MKEEGVTPPAKKARSDETSTQEGEGRAKEVREGDRLAEVKAVMEDLSKEKEQLNEYVAVQSRKRKRETEVVECVREGSITGTDVKAMKLDTQSSGERSECSKARSYSYIRLCDAQPTV